VTEISRKAADAGLKPGDCVNMVGSKTVGIVEEVEDSLKRIAGTVELQITRSKKLPAGWTSVEENGRTVLKLRTFKPSEQTVSRAQCELKLSKVAPGTRGVELANNPKGQTIVHTVSKDSPFAKHMRAGDKLTMVNGQDFSTNPLGAGRAMTSASVTLKVYGTFVPPSAECAATDCPCCTVIFGHRMAPPTVDLEAKAAQAAEAEAKAKAKTQAEVEAKMAAVSASAEAIDTAEVIVIEAKAESEADGRGALVGDEAQAPVDVADPDPESKVGTDAVKAKVEAAKAKVEAAKAKMEEAEKTEEAEAKAEAETEAVAKAETDAQAEAEPAAAPPQDDAIAA